VHGALPAAAVGAIRARSAVTVIASRWENQGYTGLEAMAQGCPLVSTDAGGHGELLQSGVTGLSVPAEDVPAYADACGRLLGDQAWAADMGRRARTYVTDVHGPERVVAQTLDVYRRCLALRATGSRA
jgi:glycosyltransferase involved in cell wall biosynthesis